jgi:hypothetical protein
MNGLPIDLNSVSLLSKTRLDKHWLSQDFKFTWKAKMPETGS